MNAAASGFAASEEEATALADRAIPERMQRRRESDVDDVQGA